MAFATYDRLGLRQLSLIAFAAFFSTSTVFAQASANRVNSTWRTFQAASGVFKVDLPGDPTISEENLNIAGMSVPTHWMKLELVSGHSFVVAHMDFSFGGNSELALDSGADGLIRSLFPKVGKVSSRTSISQAGCKGREVLFDYAIGGFVRSRFFQSDKRFFIAIYESNRFARNAQDISARFFESFVIIGGCESGITPEEAPTTYPTRFIQGTVDRESGWYRIAGNDDKFTVLMPKSPVTLETSVAAKSAFPVQLARHTYLVDNGSAIYMVSVLGDFPPSMVEKPSDYQLQLDVGERQLSNELGVEEFKLVRNMRVGEYPGREYKIGVGTRIGMVQTFSTGRKYYIFMATDERAAQTQPDFARFLSSIRLILQ